MVLTFLERSMLILDKNRIIPEDEYIALQKILTSRRATVFSQGVWR